MQKQSNENREALMPLANAKHAAHDESDVLSFWLLLLFVAVFFGIAAEEAQRASFTTPFQSATVDASMNPGRQSSNPADRKVGR